MSDLLEVLTDLGELVQVEERFAIVSGDGKRYGTRPTKALAEADRGKRDFIEREVRLASPWKVVDDD